ncbi:MAG: DUF3570 domain-containing protein [Deltaproteobacteria bacterium]|nr:DUF3570 domain-containing protein [Deltaproteobacteria bacterium]
MTRAGFTAAVAIVAAIGIVFSATPARAQQTIEGFVAGYADSEANDIVTTTAKVDGTIEGRYKLGAKVTIDAISSASTPYNTTGEEQLVDAVSSASTSYTDQAETDPIGFVGGFSTGTGNEGILANEPNFSKSRVELSGYAGAEFGENEATAGAIYSHEDIYQSATIYLTYLRYLALRNATISATYFHNFDTVDAKEEDIAAEVGYPKPKDVDGVSLTVSQVLSRKTIGKVTGYYERESGALQDPLREMYLIEGNDVYIVPEWLPTTLERYSVTGQINQGLWEGSSLQVSYRYYWDSWDIQAHTLWGQWYQYLSPQVLFSAFGRYYTQTSAKYWTPSITALEGYYTASAQLQELQANAVGARLWFLDGREAVPDFDLRAGIGFDYYTQNDRDYLVDGYDAVVLMANIAGSW